MNASEFRKLPRWKQRVLIAKDVLKRLSTKQFKPHPGIWVHAWMDDGKTMDLQKLVNAGQQCEVCALGGIMASYASKLNSIQLAPSIRDKGKYVADFGAHDAKLSRVFGKTQLELIESVFEDEEGIFIIPDSKYDAAEDFIDKYPMPEQRFKAIFQNIVKNSGTFNP